MQNAFAKACICKNDMNIKDVIFPLRALCCSAGEQRHAWCLLLFFFASYSVLFSSLPEDIIVDKVHLDCILNTNTNTCFVDSNT